MRLSLLWLQYAGSVRGRAHRGRLESLPRLHHILLCATLVTHMVLRMDILLRCQKELVPLKIPCLIWLQTIDAKSGWSFVWVWVSRRQVWTGSFDVALEELHCTFDDVGDRIIALKKLTKNPFFFEACELSLQYSSYVVVRRLASTPFACSISVICRAVAIVVVELATHFADKLPAIWILTRLYERG